MQTLRCLHACQSSLYGLRVTGAYTRSHLSSYPENIAWPFIQPEAYHEIN